MPEAGEPAGDRAPAAIFAVSRRHHAPELLLAALAGVAHALSFAPANLPALALCALAALFWLALRAATAGLALRLGLVFGTAWLGVGLSWIYISLHAYGGLWAPLASGATLVLAAGLALLPALALALAARVGAPASARRALAIAAAWTLAEWLRGVVFGGMPWISTGYAHTDGPLAGYAPVLGVYGVGAAAAASALAPAWAACARGAQARRSWIIAAAILATLLGCGQALRQYRWSADHGAPLTVRLVQGNIAQDAKFAEGGLDLALERYLPALHARADAQADAQSGARASPPPDLIVLPESAFPLPVNDLPDEVLGELADVRARQGAALIFGAFIVEPKQRYFNSAIGLGGEDQEPQRYSKRHLVPFGEFVPYGFHWFVSMLNIPLGDQERGDRYQRPMELAGQQIAVNICFEDLFGAQILDAWHDPQREPTLLLNLSNLAWFDDSIALPQHLQISRMRALETARPLLRATNTGITAIIDAQGQVVAQLAPLTQATLEGSVQATSGSTPFIRMGNLPILLLAALTLVGCALVPRSGRRANESISQYPAAEKL